MDEKRAKRAFRYGIGMLLTVVAACGIAFTIWNPLAHTAAEFLNTEMLTSSESVRETFGEPSRQFQMETDSIETWVYYVADGTIHLRFRGGRLVSAIFIDAKLVEANRRLE